MDHFMIKPNSQSQLIDLIDELILFYGIVQDNNNNE